MSCVTPHRATSRVPLTKKCRWAMDWRLTLGCIVLVPAFYFPSAYMSSRMRAYKKYAIDHGPLFIRSSHWYDQDHAGEKADDERITLRVPQFGGHHLRPHVRTAKVLSGSLLVRNEQSSIRVPSFLSIAGLTTPRAERRAPSYALLYPVPIFSTIHSSRYPGRFTTVPLLMAYQLASEPPLRWCFLG